MRMEFLLIFSLALPALLPRFAHARAPSMAIQARVRESDGILVARAEEVALGGTFEGPLGQEWHALCSIRRVLKGAVPAKEVVVVFLQPVEGERLRPAPHRLAAGKTYILFLKREGRSWVLLTPYHGALEVSDSYEVFSEERKEYRVVGEATIHYFLEVQLVTIPHDVLVEKITSMAQAETEALRRNTALPREVVLQEESERWSEMVNGLQARLVVKDGEKCGETRVLDVVLELKNASSVPISIMDDGYGALSFKLTDLRGNPVPHAGAPRSGGLVPPQWNTIPGCAYVGFSLYDSTFGISPAGGAFLALPDVEWHLGKGEYVLQARLAVADTGGDRPDNVWSGMLELPPVKIVVEDSGNLRTPAPDRAWIDPPESFTGTWALCGRDGRKWVEGGYRDGKYHGTYTKWHDNGRKELEFHYTDGKGHGTMRQWHENGQKLTESHCRDGQPFGTSTGWHENGQKSYEGQYRDGKRHGTWTHWYSDGQKRSEEGYKNGERHGTSTSWYEKGQKDHEFNYKDGKKHGTRSSWDEQGKLHYIKHYENGEFIRWGKTPGQ